MIGHWMLYALAVSVLAAVAALVAEMALVRLGRPTRWAWAVAMAVSLAAPVAAARPRPVVEEQRATPAATTLGEMTYVVVDAATPERPESGGLLLALWALGAAAGGLVLAGSWLSLARQRRGWRRAEVDGCRVWVSKSTGPAVVGFLRPAVVLPAWVEAAGPEKRRLVLAHEREHLLAGDSRLLLLSLLAVAVVPWNLPLWWQQRRLRLAMETDCDRRVLESEPDVRRYGMLLVEVAGRMGRRALPLAAFAESPSLLERRIRMMTTPTTRRRLSWAGALLAAVFLAPAALFALPRPAPLESAALRAAVLEHFQLQQPAAPPAPPLPAAAPKSAAAPDPSAAPAAAPVPAPTAAPPAVPAAAPAPLAPIAAPPAAGAPPAPPAPSGIRPAAVSDTVPTSGGFTYEVAVLEKKPELLNRKEVAEMLDRYYPRMLQDAGIGGQTVMQYVIEKDGTVDPSTIKVVSTSHEQFADASSKVVEKFRFSPGLYKGRPVRVLIQMPITWQPRTPRDTVPDFRGVGTADGSAAPAPAGGRRPRRFEVVGFRTAPDYGTVSGVVTSAETGAPIAGATVVIPELHLGAVTAEDGRFVFRVSPAGAYSVTTLAPGAREPVATPVEVQVGGTESVTIRVRR